MFKKKNSIVLVSLLALSLFTAGCGASGSDSDDKTKTEVTTEAKKADDKKDTTEAKSEEKKETTEAKSEEKKETTEAKSEEKKETTEAKSEEKKETTEAKSEEKKESTETSDEKYAGLYVQDAMDRAIDYAGAGYKVVSTEKAYLRNVEKWLIGVVRLDGTDDTVYYIYVGDDEVVPQSEVPYVPNENPPETESADPDLENEMYAGLYQIDAVNKAVEYAGVEDYMFVSAEKSYLRNVEKWLIAVQRFDQSDDTIYYIYVDENEVVPQTDLP